MIFLSGSFFICRIVVKSNETGNGTNVSNNNTTLTNVSLNVTKVSDKAMVNVGENLTYTITVTNKGSSVEAFWKATALWTRWLRWCLPLSSLMLFAP